MGLNYYVDINTVRPSYDANKNYVELLKQLAESFENNITMMDICAGSGCVGFSVKNNSNKIDRLSSVEINPDPIHSMKKTIEINKLENIDCIQSDCLDNVPQRKYQLISANPPHFEVKGTVDGCDYGWSFHKKFLNSITDYMDDDSYLTLIEHGLGLDILNFKLLMPNTLFVFHIEKFTNSPFYCIILKKKLTI